MIVCHQVPTPGEEIAGLCRRCGHAMLMHSAVQQPCAVCKILAVAEQLSAELLPVITQGVRAKHGRADAPWVEPSQRPDNAVDVNRFGSLEPEWIAGRPLGELIGLYRLHTPGPEPVLDMTPSHGVSTIYRVDDQEVSREEFERVATGNGSAQEETGEQVRD